jgi:hypothetical protein
MTSIEQSGWRAAAATAIAAALMMAVLMVLA